MPNLEYYTTKELAKKLNVNYRTILNEINRGNLRSIKIGNMNVISYEDYEAYIAKSSTVKPLEVAVAVVEKVSKVLLVQRKAKEGVLHWQFPAGRMKYSEKSETRAEIECLQETGVHCKTTKFFGKRVHPNTKVVIYYWLCDYIAGKAYNADDAENSAVMWASKKKALELFTSDVFKPVKEYLSS